MVWMSEGVWSDSLEVCTLNVSLGWNVWCDTANKSEQKKLGDRADHATTRPQALKSTLLTSQKSWEHWDLRSHLGISTIISKMSQMRHFRNFRDILNPIILWSQGECVGLSAYWTLASLIHNKAPFNQYNGLFFLFVTNRAEANNLWMWQWSTCCSNETNHLMKM